MPHKTSVASHASIQALRYVTYPQRAMTLLALHVTYLKYISRYGNTFLKRFHCTVLILTYTQPYFAICAGTNTWMSI